MIPLGKVIQDREFPEVEWERISDASRNGGLPGKVLRRHISQSEIFKIFAKRLKIPGHSNMRPAFVSKATENLIAAMVSKDPLKAKEKDAGRKIYEQCVVIYISTVQPKLNDLLKKTMVGEGQYSTDQLLEILLEKASEHDVSHEAIKELYELWGFERSAQAEAIFEKYCSLNAQTLLQRRLSHTEDEVEALKKRADELERTASSESTSTLNKHAELANGIGEIHTSLESLSADHARVANSMKGLTERVGFCESSGKTVKENFASELTNVNDRIGGFETRLSSFNEHSKERDKKVEESLSALEKEFGELLKRQGHDAPTAKALHALIEKMGKEAPGPSSSEYKSPLRNRPPAPRTVSPKITDEKQFVSLWARRLREDEGLNIELERAAIYHSFFKASNVLVLEEDTLALSWLRMLDWSARTLFTVASPSWSSESDWKAEAEFVFGNENNKDDPRILFIYNFNEGVPEAYLIPSLKLWSLAPDRFPLSKIILIRTESREEGPPPELLELALYLPQAELVVERTLPHGKLADPARFNGKEVQHTGVKSEIFRQWLPVLSPTWRAYYEVDELTKSGGVWLPRSVKSLFYRGQQALRTFFDEQDSQQIAAYHCICPWIGAKHGADKRDEFYSYLKLLFNKALNY